MRVDSTGLIVGKSGGSTGGGRVDVAIVMKCTGFNNKFQDSLSCVCRVCNRTFQFEGHLAGLLVIVVKP